MPVNANTGKCLKLQVSFSVIYLQRQCGSDGLSSCAWTDHKGIQPPTCKIKRNFQSHVQLHHRLLFLHSFFLCRDLERKSAMNGYGIQNCRKPPGLQFYEVIHLT